MGATVTVKKATRSRLTLLVAGDGTATHIITQAVLAAAMVDGPLKTQWTKVHTTQAAMRAALLEEKGRIVIRARTQVADTTAQVNQPAADVDTDAVSTTKAEINLQLSDTTGQEFYIDLETFGIGA